MFLDLDLWLLGARRNMEAMTDFKEGLLVERELNELFETTLRLECELELVVEHSRRN